ncbi:hypothetical protein DYB36_007908 [Aphanomyces astaci]|uniref:Uncharacterized protein n=1 Tax=Aphanomyces astaci TaxID=112090 RepID=A0A397A8R7_APHAT|nr:hypothetical protein DYB36_007908 [Aphanomyces astaci]
MNIHACSDDDEKSHAAETRGTKGYDAYEHRNQLNQSLVGITFNTPKPGVVHSYDPGTFKFIVRMHMSSDVELELTRDEVLKLVNDDRAPPPSIVAAKNRHHPLVGTKVVVPFGPDADDITGTVLYFLPVPSDTFCVRFLNGVVRSEDDEEDAMPAGGLHPPESAFAAAAEYAITHRAKTTIATSPSSPSSSSEDDDGHHHHRRHRVVFDGFSYASSSDEERQARRKRRRDKVLFRTPRNNPQPPALDDDDFRCCQLQLQLQPQPQLQLQQPSSKKKKKNHMKKEMGMRLEERARRNKPSLCATDSYMWRIEIGASVRKGRRPRRLSASKKRSSRSKRRGNAKFATRKTKNDSAWHSNMWPTAANTKASAPDGND